MKTTKETWVIFSWNDSEYTKRYKASEIVFIEFVKTPIEGREEINYYFDVKFTDGYTMGCDGIHFERE